MPIVDHDKVPEIEMRAGIRGRFLANKDLGSTGVSLLYNVVQPGASAPSHTHTVEETMLVLEGTVWAEIGDERHEVGPNHTVIIPPHTPHAWGNSGPEPAKLLWAFAGADPFSDAAYLDGTPPVTSKPG